MKTTAKPQLKRSWFLQTLAICFLLAPIGNIAISFYGTGRTDWTHPQVFILWLKTIDPVDWLWLSLTFFTGFLLLIQHKTSWIIAVFNLILIMVINAYRWVTTGELIDVDYGYFQAQTMISTLGTVLGLGVIFYFRYPYLDRRSGWFHYALPRFELNTPVTLMAQDVFDGHTVNLSLSGALVQLSRPLGVSAQMKLVDVIFPEIKNLKIECQVIHHNASRVRLKFRGLRGENRKIMQDWIEARL